MKKTCNKCKEEKLIEEFTINKAVKGGREHMCRICKNLAYKAKWQKNKEINAIKRSEKRKRNIEVYRKREAEYRKKYRDANKEKVNEKYRNYMKEYRKSRPAFRMHKRISYIIKSSLDNRCSSNQIFVKLGYNIEDLMKHLESKFKPGMSWDNYGEWHIDHIVPQSWLPFNSVDEENFLKCWSLNNLQPLWAKENISKSNRFSGSKENPTSFLYDLHFP